MTKRLKGDPDDALAKILLPDFSGGLCTLTGALGLASNQTPDCSNVIGLPDRLIHRGGYGIWGALATAGDQAFDFVDINGNKHYMVWSAGNLYDFANGAPVTVATAVYTAGQQIGVTTLNQVMYWSTITVPLRQYNGTTEMQVPNSGGSGVIAPPAAKYLTVFAGSIIAGNINLSGSLQPNVFGGSDVNDPTTWYASNFQSVGSDGGGIDFVQVMGVAAVGVPPTASILIGNSQQFIFIYSGALGAFKEQLVNCPVGCLDGNSVVYMPNISALGAICFLATDGQFWVTNGITSECISLNILDLCFATTQNARSINPGQKFFASYNERWQYYVCDMGNNQQFAWRWNTQAWFKFYGIPSGPIMQGSDSNGFPILFSVGNIAGYYGMWELGIDNATDNGVINPIYYNTPFLHANNPDLEKEWQEVTLIVLNNTVGATFSVIGQTNPIIALNGLQFSSTPLLLTNSQAQNPGNELIWNVGNWNQRNWAGGVSSATQSPLPLSGRLTVPMSAYPTQISPYLRGMSLPSQPLRSPMLQLQIAFSSGTISFDIIGIIVRWYETTTKTVGGQLYQNQSGVTAGFSPYVTNAENL